jgi:hypothetical protein
MCDTVFTRSEFMGLANRFLTMALLATSSLVLVGCHGDNGVGPLVRPFSVRFSDEYFHDGRGWVVVHTPGGDSSVSAVRVAGNGTVNLMSSGSHAAFTIVKITPPRFEFDDTRIILTSYMGVPVGTFFARGPGPVEPLGWAAVTITYPFGFYTDRLVSAPNTVTVSPPAEADSDYHTVMPIYQTEPDGTISIYASVQDSTFGYCGWLLDQTFLPGDTQSYSLRLDRPLQHRSVSATQSVEDWGLIGYRRTSWASYGINHGASEGGMTSFDVLYGAFPVSKWLLWGISGLVGLDWHSSQHISSSVPSSLTMPEMSLISEYDSQNDRFTNIAVTGTPDILMCAWHGYLHGYISDRIMDWEVWTSPESRSVGRPALPDSVLADIVIPSTEIEPDYQLLWNFEPAEGFEDLARRIYLSDLPWAAQFTDLQAWSRPYYLALDRQLALSDDSASTRFRHHQFR